MPLPILHTAASSPRPRLPSWLKRPLPDAGPFAATARVVADAGLATVCREARCPNLTECWSRKTATFMILGQRCTRRCRYCSVTTARPLPPSPTEPERLAAAADKLALRHVVITAVARDDLPDEGSGHFAACVRAVRERLPRATIEVLPADFHARRDCIDRVMAAGPDIYNHNLETVERVTPIVRSQGDYRRSLDHLAYAREAAQHLLTKSGLMVGLGENTTELEAAMRDLRDVGCDILTLGQYLQPSPRHFPVDRYYRPEDFESMARFAQALGFLAVAAAPFVRSSYNADAVFEQTRTGPFDANQDTDTRG